jgi:hypothetical protein
LVLVVGNHLIDLLDQTGQGVVGLTSEDHDDRPRAESSAVAKLIVNLDPVLDTTNLHDLKCVDRLASLQTALHVCCRNGPLFVRLIRFRRYLGCLSLTTCQQYAEHTEYQAHCPLV